VCVNETAVGIPVYHTKQNKLIRFCGQKAKGQNLNGRWHTKLDRHSELSSNRPRGSVRAKITLISLQSTIFL